MKTAFRKLSNRLAEGNTSKILIGIIFAVLVLFPLIRMFLYIDAKSFGQVVSNSVFHTAVVNSVTVSLIATAITLIIAYLLALCLQRTNIRLKSMFSILFIIPMLIPSLSHGMGLIILFGNNGILTNLFQMNSNIYGMWGIIIGSVMYAFPIAFLMFNDVLKYEDASPYEAARILGIPKHRQFLSITLPYLRKPLISVTFAVFTLIITDYGVPLMVGGKFPTVPVIMYQEVIGQLNFSKGSVYGLVLLIPAVIAFIFDLLNKDKAASHFIAKKFELVKGKLTSVVSYLYCGLVSLCALTPVAAFVCLAFAQKYPSNLSFTTANISKTFGLGADNYLVNSIVIALLVSLIGTALSFVTAYLTARMKSKLSKFLHLISITSAAIPGVVLGLSYVIVFKGSFIYGTLAILIMVNIIHFVASPYLMMYNSLNKVNENLEAVGQTLGIGRFKMIKDVILPQVRFTMTEMVSYFFVNSMMTISAVSFLATTQNKPVSLMINQFEAQMQIECAAVVSLAILLVNLLMKGIIYLVKRLQSRRNKSQSLAV